MTKKITRLEDFIPASDAADLLSQKLDRPIDPKYIRLLAKRKKNPIRTEQKGDRWLYNRIDILATDIKQKGQ